MSSRQDKEILIECWKEIDKKERQGKEMTRWQSRRKDFFGQKGKSTTEVAIIRRQWLGIEEETKKMGRTSGINRSVFMVGEDQCAIYLGASFQEVNFKIRFVA